METPELYQQPVILCKICDNLLCYEGYIKQHGIDKNSSTKTNIFEVMFNYSIQELDNTLTIIGIYCSICQSYLGIKYREQFYICKEKYKSKPYKVNIKVFSLDSECIDFMISSIDIVRKGIKLEVETKKETLLKSKLKNIDPDFSECDGCILIHKNSGRLLLTDENGLYDHQIKLAFEKCVGNIFLAIHNDDFDQESSSESDNEQDKQSQSTPIMLNRTHNTGSPSLIKSILIKQKRLPVDDDIIDSSPNRSSGKKRTAEDYINTKTPPTKNKKGLKMHTKKPKRFYDSLYNKRKIFTLVNEGKQPFMDQLSKQHRVIDVKQNLNEHQSIYLSNFLHACLYKGQIHDDFLKFNVEQKYYDIKFYSTKVDTLKDVFEDFERIFNANKELIESFETIIDNVKTEYSNSDESICRIF